MDDVVELKVVEREIKELPSKSKNTCLYFFEALACCLIVFIHCEFPGDFGIFMNASARFGVPLFFAIAGFYLFKQDMTKEDVRRRLKTRIIRVSILLCFSFFIYFIVGLLSSVFGKEDISIVKYLQSIFSWKRIALLLVCNNPLANTVNWFMLAMLFSYIIIFIFPNLFIKNKFFVYIVSCLSIFWMIFRIIVNVIHAELFGYSLTNDFLYRSWYANGLIFICFGIVLKRNISLLSTISTRTIIVILLSSFTIMIIEHFLMVKLLGKGNSYYFGSIGCVLSILVLSTKHPYLFSRLKILKLKGNWTRFVYIFHPAVITLLSFVINWFAIDNVVINWLKPVIVLLLTFIAALCFNFILENIKKYMETKKNKNSTVN